MYKNIMVPLDGSHNAEGALATAADLARRSGARLHLAQVVSWIHELTDLSTPRSPRRYLNRIANSLAASHGIQVEVDLLSDAINGVAYGEPPRRAIAEVLDDHARKANIDITVMTTHGRGGFKRVWIGSVADSMLRRMDSSVLMLKSGRPVRRMAAIMANRILIPVDVARNDEEVVARAIELGELYDAEYTLLHVASPAVSFIAASATELLEGGLASADYAQAQLERLAHTIADTGHRVQTAVVTMPFVSSEIIAYSQDHQFDLVAMATRGPNSIERMILGSVSDKVIRASTVPVFACNVSRK